MYLLLNNVVYLLTFMSGIALYECFSVLLLLFNIMFVRKKRRGYSVCQGNSYLYWERKGSHGSFRGARKDLFLNPGSNSTGVCFICKCYTIQVGVKIFLNVFIK